MKPLHSNRFAALATILLGSAILFASCTKKDLLEMPTKQDSAISLPAQSSNAQLPLLKGNRLASDYEGTFKPKVAHHVMFIASGIQNASYPMAKCIHLETYMRSVSGSLILISSTVGDSYRAVASFQAIPGNTYYFKVATQIPGNAHAWVPPMQIGDNYVLLTPANPGSYYMMVQLIPS